MYSVIYLRVFFTEQEEEEKELAVIFLQQLIRGRAVQNMVSYQHIAW